MQDLKAHVHSLRAQMWGLKAHLDGLRAQNAGLESSYARSEVQEAKSESLCPGLRGSKPFSYCPQKRSEFENKQERGVRGSHRPGLGTGYCLEFCSQL